MLREEVEEGRLELVARDGEREAGDEETPLRDGGRADLEPADGGRLAGDRVTTGLEPGLEGPLEGETPRDCEWALIADGAVRTREGGTAARVLRDPDSTPPVPGLLEAGRVALSICQILMPR